MNGGIAEDPQRFARAFEHAPLGVAITDEQGVCTEVNPALCRMLGRSPRELLGAALLAVTHPDDRGASQSVHETLAQGGRDHVYQRTRYVRPDGSVLWADVSVAAVRDGDGRVRYQVVHVMDATDLVGAELVRRAAAEQFERFVDQAPDPVIVVDGRGVVTLCNRRTTEVFGYTPDELRGRPIEVLVPERAREAHAVVRARYSTAPAPRPMGTAQLRGRRKDGTEFDIDVSLGPIDAPDGPSVVAIARDLSERRRARIAIETERAQSEFLSRMSHELRTPLNSVLGFAQLLEMGELSEQQREAVSHIMRAGAHLRDLLTDVLEYERAQSGRIAMVLEPLAVEGVVADALGIVAPFARQHGVQLAAPPDGTSWARADHGRLRQILINLLTNAVKYNRAGGRVDVTVTRDVDVVTLAVRDNGRGIDPAQLHLLFTPFERLGAETTGIEGAGVGLPLARSLTEAMEGRIEVDSALGRGSTFSVHLVAAVPGSAGARAVAAVTRAAGDAAPAAAPRPPARRGAVILYVDDNDANVVLVEQMLERRGMVRMVSAATVADGVAIARRLRPDIVLLDLHLPDGEGEDVIVALRADAETAAIPVVAVTADATPVRMREVLDAGAVAYVTKPVVASELYEAIDTALGS